MSTPKVSVVLPVRNSQPYLQEAVSSIFLQSYSNFELICIDDATTDSGARLMDAIHDPRWILVRHRTALGLTASLNEGLVLARGKYIARMDGDDISHPQRLAEQVSFLEKNPEIDVVGSWARTIGIRPAQVWRYPASDAEIQAEMLFNSVLVHSSVMLRKSTFDRRALRYGRNINRAQDYELWTRPAANPRLANLPKPLLFYRLHMGQIGRNFGAQQQKTASMVRKRQLHRLRIQPTEAQLRLHNLISLWQFGSRARELEGVEDWLLGLNEANTRYEAFDAAAFGRVLERRWWAACRTVLSGKKQAWNVYAASPLAALGQRTLADKATFWAKSRILWR